jgi:tripartite-type tricarboxylate transporter receptor subunit TctC
LIQQGKVKALAFTGTTRSRDLPEVPTMPECGFPQLTSYFWQGLLAPAGTSNAVVERLRRAVHKSLSSAEVQAALEKLGLEPQVTSPEELSERLASEVRRWPPIVKAAGMRPE